MEKIENFPIYFSKKVVGIAVKTSSTPGASTGAAVIKTDLCGENNQCCHMEDFNNPGPDLTNEYEFGLYQNDELLGCKNFPLHGFKSMKLEFVDDEMMLGLENGSN